jgi:phenylpyruvate tautomerase PptA (4-oxalocrotonate tautomerase family)
MPFVNVKVLKSGDWVVGGRAIATADARALAARKTAA